MKRSLTFITLLLCTFVTAQNSIDVLRFSSENTIGTARFQAMSGAFGALGGDLSALNANPAGVSVFNYNQGVVSVSHYGRSNEISYGGNATGTYPGYLDINQAGGVLVFKSSEPSSEWGKIAVAVNYDIVNNFNNELSISGQNTEGIDNYFLNFAQGVPFGDITLRDGEFIEDAYLDIGSEQGFADQQAFLGYFGGIIDPENMEDSNTNYLSNANYSNVNQNLSRITQGYNSKFTVTVGSQYAEKLHLGASLNFHSIVYTRNDEFTENNYDVGSEITQTTFDNRLFSEGTGFSLNLGLIAKVTDALRVGASYQSPTWYRLQDNLQQRISSDLADADINFINFDLVNVFPRYTIKSPAKVTGSLALVFGKNGLLSFDYGIQDMSQARLGPTSDANFSTINDDISNELTTVTSLRLGGEYRINRFSLRGGYRFEGSPYEDGNLTGDLEGISGGIGYDFGASKLDLAISRYERDTTERLFDSGITTPALIDNSNTNVTLSYTTKF